MPSRGRGDTVTATSTVVSPYVTMAEAVASSAGPGPAGGQLPAQHRAPHSSFPLAYRRDRVSSAAALSRAAAGRFPDFPPAPGYPARPARPPSVRRRRTGPAGKGRPSGRHQPGGPAGPLRPRVRSMPSCWATYASRWAIWPGRMRLNETAGTGSGWWPAPCAARWWPG